MDGFETAALIRERERSANTPIIFLTALSDTETCAARGYSLGAVDYIHMPVQPEVLKSKVSVFVELFLKSEQVRLQAQSLRDVQEREHAARLAEASNRLDSETRRNRFFTLAADMLGVVSLDGRLRQLNASWEATLGFSEAELQREPIWSFLHPDDQQAMVAAFAGLAQGAPTARFENRHRHRGGSYRWLAWTAVPFLEEGLVYLFARDVTWRKAVEEERVLLAREQEARRVAQHENALKDQLEPFVRGSRSTWPSPWIRICWRVRSLPWRERAEPEPRTQPCAALVGHALARLLPFSASVGPAPWRGVRTGKDSKMLWRQQKDGWAVTGAGGALIGKSCRPLGVSPRGLGRER
jgi:PAS domain S-box-containing protein